MSPQKLIDYQKLKARVSLGEVLDHYKLDLDERGDQLVGDCPLCGDSDPEATCFSANTAKNGWKCFACGEHGNILSIVAAMEDLSEREASVLIAGWFGAEDCYLARKSRGQKRATSKGIGNGRQSRRRPSESLAHGTSAFNDPSYVSIDERRSELTENIPLEFKLQNLEVRHELVRSLGISSRLLSSVGAGMCFSGSMKGRLVVPYYSLDSQLLAYCGIDLSSEKERRLKLPPHNKFNPELELMGLNFAALHFEKTAPDCRVLYLTRDPVSALRLSSMGVSGVVATVTERVTPSQLLRIDEVLGEGDRVELVCDGMDDPLIQSVFSVSMFYPVRAHMTIDEKAISRWRKNDLDAANLRLES